MEKIKIIIMGMENAGKTSILNTLIDESSEIPENPPELVPTKMAGISSHFLFDKEIMIWDFGGQEMFRNEYVSRPEMYFQQVEVFSMLLIYKILIDFIPQKCTSRDYFN